MGIFTATGQIGVSFQNNTGSALSLGDIAVAFAIEQWRQRSVVPVMTFAYVVSGSPVSIPFDDAAAAWVTKSELAFSGAAGTDIGLDGNLAANRQSFSAVALAGSGTLGAGEYLTLRWQMTSGGQVAGGLAVDDFALQVIPEPGTWSLLAGVMALGLGLGRRRRG